MDHIVDNVTGLQQLHTWGDWVGQDVGVDGVVLLRTWQCCMAEIVKRKLRKSSSASSTDDNLSPDGKKLRHDVWLLDSEPFESDEVLTMLNMAGEVIPKLGQVLEKLENLERYVKAVDEEVSNLQAKVNCFEAFKNKTENKIKELEDGLDFASTECGLLRRNLTS